MAMLGQALSPAGQVRLRPFERAPRPLVGYTCDYPAGHRTGRHSHPRAQLLFAVAGVMRIETARALFVIPAGTGLWVPADTNHEVRMDGPVAMRALFLRPDAAAAGPPEVTVIAVSPLLRELILTVCNEPVVWDRRGPIRLVAALALHEIGRAAARPLSLPACRDPRLKRVADSLAADPADPRDLDAHALAAGASVRTLTRLFRAETGMSFHQWRRQLRMIEAMALLGRGEAPARVAAAVGFASVPAFGAAFRETFGITPSAVAPRRVDAGV
ncbi:AraC family transcriptional regulator [Rhodopila sp.]|jgi:AraC-like DNA-binding protein/quercetin dioxygenase-like cupin family protein|uniref:AraC family transcriptional regulator n=1 Tax=Rhodopila sp. TaxID=2480087 RepID=UPI002C273168|nr:helix-turn-helix transcriptional regulator [Rhodopila sp.]HVZ06947.1 helix-turn-helix transcriptional regulator [Rhodopila sp.]